MAVSYNQILADLKRKTYHPIYMLCGEEPYFIDLLCHVFENQILSADEKEFNQQFFTAGMLMPKPSWNMPNGIP